MINSKNIVTFFALFLTLGIFAQNPLTISFSVSHVLNGNDAQITAVVMNGSSNVTALCLNDSGTNISLIDTNQGSTGYTVSATNLEVGVYYFHVSDGANHLYQYVWVGKYGQSNTLTIQPDENYGIDAELNFVGVELDNLTPEEMDTIEWQEMEMFESIKNTNYGTTPSLKAFHQTTSGYSSMSRSLIKFRFNGLESSTIEMSELTLYGYGFRNQVLFGDPGIENQIELLKCEDFWNEDLVSWSGEEGTELQPFATDDGKIEAPLQGEPDTRYTEEDFEHIFDITEFTSEFNDDPTTNNGFLLKLVEEYRYRNQSFHSSNSSDASKKPKLTVTFSLPEVKSFTNVTKKQSSGYVLLEGDRKIGFSYKEEYKDQDGLLAYKIYNDKHEVVMTQSNVPLYSQTGMNRYILNIDCCLECSKFFLLEVTNEKNEKWYLRFKTDPNDGSNGGEVIVYPQGHPCSLIGE